MPVIIDDAIRNDSSLGPAVDQAEKILSSVLGLADQRVDRRWGLAPAGRGRPLVELTVTDEFDTTGATTFTPQQIADSSAVEDRLVKFWGDLLKEKSHKLLARLRQRVATLED